MEKGKTRHKIFSANSRNRELSNGGGTDIPFFLANVIESGAPRRKKSTFRLRRSIYSSLQGGDWPIGQSDLGRKNVWTCYRSIL